MEGALEPLQGGIGLEMLVTKRITGWNMFWMFFFDIFLSPWKTFFEGLAVKEFLDGGHARYAAFTVFAMALPGLLGLLYYLHEFFCGGGMTKCKFFSGILQSLFFPVYLPLRLAYHLACHMCGPDKGKRLNQWQVMAKTHALNNMAHLTKGPMQMIFQNAILMVLWFQQNSFNHVYQTLLIFFNVIMMAKTLTDNYFFVISGKNLSGEASYLHVGTKNVLNVTHILIQGFIVALMGAYLKAWSLVPGTLWILLNWAAAKCCLKTHWNKEVYTALAGLLAPTAFISRHTISKRHTKATTMWRRYSRWNAVIFFIMVVLGVIFTDFLLLDNLILGIELHNIDCNHLPFLSYDAKLQCPANSTMPDLDTMTKGGHLGDIADYLTANIPEAAPHKWWFIFNPVLVVLALINTLIVFIFE